MKLTLFAAAAALTLAAGSAQAAGSITAKSKISLCHRTGATEQITPTGPNATPITVNRGVVISVPVKAALNHVQQHQDVPLGPNLSNMTAGKKCLAVVGSGNIVDDAGAILQNTRQILQDLIDDITDADLQDLKAALQDLLDKLT